MQPRRLVLVTARPEAHGPLLEALRLAGFQVAARAEPGGGPPADLAVVDLTTEALWAVAELLSGGHLMLIVPRPADMRRGFELGADDCLLPDAHPDEVVARVEAVLRRTVAPPEAPAGEPAVYVDRRLWVNFASRQVWVAGRPAQLTPREFRLLQFFLRHRDETVTHETILAEVWDRPMEDERPSEVLKQYIWRLRQKVEADPEQPEVILTVPGVGYRFASLDV